MIVSLILSCLIHAGSTLPVNNFSKKTETLKPKGEVTVYVTTGDGSLDFQKSTLNFTRKVDTAPFSITLNPETTYQTMDGFGAAITGSTCYNLMKMKKADRTKFLRETFSEKDGMGMSYIRIAIGCSDFSLSEYTCWDKPGKENFGLQLEEKQYVIPVLKELLAINPNLKIIGSPWTPPKWMKVNNLTERKPFDSWTSGQLNPEHYQDYAWYFVQWLEAFKKEGIHIAAVTPQNEPLNRGNSASLYMSWQEQLDFIKGALGPQLKAANLPTKIYAFDHNYNYDNIESQRGYPLNIYNDAVAASYITGSAYHNYGGNKNELLHIHNQQPDKEIIFTETSIGEWNDGRNLNKRLIEDMSEVGIGTINRWSKAVIVWNLMLDSDKGPYREGGCKTCYGAVDIQRSDYKTISKNSHYYVIGHLSVAVKPGATRIAATGGNDSNIEYSAFKNTDGTYALVLLNKAAEAKEITLNDSKNYISYQVPARAVVSFRWKN
ncbi:glycoside hydrolase family 30 protein [Sphingobacterium sp. Mn56C]|uniref:glycoside hydrolase family 30 protein n=1 Tax=Sphingobacterium sp. Mn56C TaxID=3395261 RepID=UPI003BE4D101